MTARQFARWYAYSQVEPFGALRDDYRAAQVGAAIVNNIPLRGKGAKTLRPDDFFASLKAARGRQSAKDMAAALTALALRMGGQVIDRKKAPANG